MKKTLLIAALFLIVAKAVCMPPPSINPPNLYYAILHNNGDVTLYWFGPSDPDTIFDSYHVYSSSNINGPFIKIDSIFNYNQQAKTYIGVGQKYFYITSRDTNHVYSLSSDTLRSLICDAGVIAIIKPQADSLQVSSIDSVKVVIKNFGQNTLYSTEIMFTINGVIYDSIIWSGVLLPNAVEPVILGIIPVPIGYFTICAKTNLRYDVVSSNDLFCKTYFGLTTDIEENTFNNNDICISPNPFSHSTQINLNETYQNIALAVYDIQGKQVVQHHYTNCSQIQLNRNNLTNGLYFVKLTLNDKQVATVKMVVGD